MRARLACLFFVVACWPALAQSPPSEPDTWSSDPRTGCKVRDADNGAAIVSWSGPCVGGLAQGKGTLQVSKDGKAVRTYVGDMLGGKRNGRAVMTFPSGTRYDGEFKNDRRHGYGVQAWPDGNRYAGNWRDGLPNGQGTMTIASSGKSYTGNWVNGCLRQDGTVASAFVPYEDCK